MQDILSKQVDRGFDSNKRDASELPRGSAADGSQNVLYSRGTIKTPYGFGKVESGSLPLDSGNAVLLTGTYSELDKTQHFLAVTKDKIHQRDYENGEWDDITQSGVALQGNVYNPMSMASILHTDGLALNGSGDDWYHHCLICTGVSPIQRWAGKFETDFADLVGADGYHAVGSGVSTHYALQVGAFYNRPILISAKEADSNGSLIDCNQRVRWPMAGKLEIWTGSGSGYRDLLDTGGYNIWGALLGTQWIQYQNNSIWSLTHVGGTRVFEPDIEIPNLGLLAPHLLYSKNNVHYFIGNDYNVYAYFGGSHIERIGDKIHRYLQRDLDPEYKNRCWIYMGAENSRLWIFIVPNGETFITQGYGIDMQSGSWMKRDFLHKWPTGTGGIASVSLVGASSYYSGASYQEALALTTTYAEAIAAGTTYRQALQETLVEERMVLGDSDGYVYQYDSDLTQDDDVNIPSRHITEVYDLGVPGKNKLWPGIRVTAKGTGLIVAYRTGNFETTDTGWIYPHSESADWIGVSSSNYDSHCGDDGTRTIEEALDGNNYWRDVTTHTHWVILDLGQPYIITKVRARTNAPYDPTDVNIYVSDDKASWGTAVASGISTWQDTESWVEADTTDKDGRYIKIEIVDTENVNDFLNFGGSPIAFTIFDVYGAIHSQTLTSEFVTYEFTVWDTSKKIQFRFTNADGDTFQISNYELIEPVLQGEV